MARLSPPHPHLERPPPPDPSHSAPAVDPAVTLPRLSRLRVRVTLPESKLPRRHLTCAPPPRLPACNLNQPAQDCLKPSSRSLLTVTSADPPQLALAFSPPPHPRLLTSPGPSRRNPARASPPRQPASNLYRPVQGRLNLFQPVQGCLQSPSRPTPSLPQSSLLWVFSPSPHPA